MNSYTVTPSELEILCKKASEEILQVLDESDRFTYVTLYGVPRGGIPVAYAIAEILNNHPSFTKKQSAKVVFNPSQASFIVDDLVDSGKTKEQYIHMLQGPEYFIALIDKKRDNLADYWVKFPWECNDKGVDTSAEDIPLRFLQFIGEDPEREGLKETPSRVIKSWEFLYSGYAMDQSELFKTFSNPGCDEMVILDHIEFYSTCEHHLLPFFGQCHIAYIPRDKVVGVSKLARLVDLFSRRLQIQENLTQQIADTIQHYLDPLGVGVIMTAQHFCMTSRGVQKQKSVMKTSALSGVFKQPEVRAEFLKLITL